MTPATPRPRAKGDPTDDARTALRQADVATEDIARRAYQLYEWRGGEPGHDVEDWLKAERELKQRHHLELGLHGDASRS